MKPKQTPTFKTRSRPLSGERQQRLAELLNRFGLDEEGPRIDLSGVFGPERSAGRLVVEIGMGFGESLVAMASADPGTNVIGCDVHTPGVLATLEALAANELDRVRVVHGDALVFLGRLGPGCLDEIRLFFPDPWPKAGHRHRRMVTEARIRQLVRTLRDGGRLHVVTDIADYALQTQRVCHRLAQLEGGVVPKPPGRVRTKYEKKAWAAGRPVTDLIFVRHRTAAGL